MHGQSQSHSKAPLAQWIRNTLRVREGKLAYRVRGNTLHILCDAKVCPDQRTLTFKLVTALQQVDINSLMPDGSSPIYQILLYGRREGMQQPIWTAPVYLNQLSHHIAQLQHANQSQHSSSVKAQPGSSQPSRAAAQLASKTENLSPPSATSTAALILSNRSLARQGNEEAIARYLSEVLETMGVAVRVSVKTIPYKPQLTLSIIELPSAPDLAIAEAKRLWITCEASYSPDPGILGEPLAQRLRDLELEHFHDAIILIQVRGEEHPDWGLRVDLTPTHEILREWGRWGDAAAIDRLLKQPLAERHIELSTTSLKDATLHLFFGNLAPVSSNTAPDPQVVREVIAPILETLGPQGVQAAALYGSIAEQEAPAWVEWLDLPAAKYPALADSPLALAQANDWGAIAFLLNRLLNPDLDQYLTTGGIRVQALPKGDLLHIMTDAPTCPSQSQVGPLVGRFFQQLHLPAFAGVRVYGRRAGQKRPAWSYGMDFQPRTRLVPEATPEFAATDALVSDLIAHPDADILRPDLTTADIQTAWSRLTQRLREGIQTALIKTQLVIPMPESSAADHFPALAEPRYQSAGVTAIWVAVGVLIAVQANWGLRWLLQTIPDPTAVQEQAAVPPDAMQPTPLPESSAPDAAFPELELEKWHSDDPADNTFNASGFTSMESTALPYSEELNASQALAASILAAEPSFSTFNSRQLDEKLALYQRLLETSGPPDVLIIGSSRALRGVDPVALKTYLAELGYQDLTIFNFGINGATAQVVDLIIRGVLTPDQLPKLILWADGARAMNSGALDITYNGIVASEGYQDLMRGKPPLTQINPWGDSLPPGESIADRSGELSLTASYEALDEWLSDRLAGLMTVHEERDRLKHLAQKGLTAFLPSQQPLSNADLSAQAVGTTPDGTVQTEDGQSLFDADGFLPLSVQFNPATYYQTYARVAGQYDSDYADFRVAGTQESALQALLAFTNAQNIPLVFVNLPLTQEYLDDVRMEYEQHFKQYMLSVAVNQGGFIFRDLGEEWPEQHNYFSDPSHLNQYGAYQVSRRLAEDPMIPWPQP